MITPVVISEIIDSSKLEINCVKKITANVDNAMFTKLFPINNVTKVLSNFSYKYIAFLDPLTLLSIMSFNLDSLHDENAVSLIEKNALNKIKPIIRANNGTLNVDAKTIDCMSNSIYLPI